MQAQIVITPTPADAVPVATETVQTTELVCTVRAAPLHTARRQIVTTRTVTRQAVPVPTGIVRTIPVAPQPLYDVAGDPALNDGNNDTRRLERGGHHLLLPNSFSMARKCPGSEL